MAQLKRLAEVKAEILLDVEMDGLSDALFLNFLNLVLTEVHAEAKIVLPECFDKREEVVRIEDYIKLPDDIEKGTPFSFYRNKTDFQGLPRWTTQIGDRIYKYNPSTQYIGYQKEPNHYELLDMQGVATEETPLVGVLVESKDRRLLDVIKLAIKAKHISYKSDNEQSSASANLENQSDNILNGI